MIIAILKWIHPEIDNIRYENEWKRNIVYLF